MWSIDREVLSLLIERTTTATDSRHRDPVRLGLTTARHLRQAVQVHCVQNECSKIVTQTVRFHAPPITGTDA